LATRTSNYQVWNESTFEWDGYYFIPAQHNHSASDITSGTLSADRIPTLAQSKIENLVSTLAGKASLVHQHDITQISLPNYVIGSVPDVMKALFDVTRADRTVFLPADQIIIEKSIDGGLTWQDAEVSDSDKRQFFIGSRPIIPIPLINGVKSCNAMLRITITGMKYNQTSATGETDRYNYWNSTYVQSNERYCTLDEGWAWVRSRADRIWMKVERASGSNSNAWMNVREAWLYGWSDGNYFKLDSATFGGATDQTSNNWNWRFTFRTGTTSYDFDDAKLVTSNLSSPQAVHHLKLTGQNVWVHSNDLMRHDHLYGWDENKNAYFPAEVKAGGITLVKTDDTRLSDARPASDVYEWAKASLKPSYVWSEIGSRPTKVSDFTNDLGFITETVAYQDFERAFTKGTAFNKNFGTGSDDVPTGNHGHTASQVGALPSSGGTLTGDLIFDVGDVDRFIKFNYIGGSAGYGWRIGYLGSGSGDANYLSFQTEQTADDNWAEVLRFGLTSKVGTFAVTPRVGTTNVSLEGHTHGNLTSDGKLGGNSYKPVITNLNGQISEGAWATLAEAEAGTSETAFMSPKRTLEAISHLMPSGGVSVTSIKNWTNSISCSGSTGATLSLTTTPTVGYIGIVWGFSDTTSHVRYINWIKIAYESDTFKVGITGIPSTSGSTYTELYRFRVMGYSTNTMKVDWVYKHTINDTAAEAHPIAAATIYVWDVLQML